jgi:hypothetical protein
MRSLFNSKSPQAENLSAGSIYYRAISRQNAANEGVSNGFNIEDPFCSVNLFTMAHNNFQPLLSLALILLFATF